MENTKEQKEIVEKLDLLTDDDDDFLKSLEDDSETHDEENEEHEESEEEKRLKNKNAEEARKRREAEAKQKAEKEAETQEEVVEEDEEVVEEKPVEKGDEEVVEEDEEDEEDEKKHPSPQDQVRELIGKYPEIDLEGLDKNQDFQEYLQGKWYVGGKTITELYEGFVDFTSRLTKTSKEEIQKLHVKKSTPNIKGSSGGTGTNTKQEDIYSIEEIQDMNRRMPFMTPKEFAKIEEKLEKSIKFHKKK